MRRIDQQVLHDPDGLDVGDCYRACLASILDDATVPHFAAIEGPEQPGAGPVWWSQARQWLRAEYGIDTASFDITEDVPTPLHVLGGDETSAWQRHGIGTVQSPRGPFTHAVVVNLDGEVVHDPHPSRASMLAPLIAVDLFFAIDDEWNPLIQPEAVTAPTGEEGTG